MSTLSVPVSASLEKFIEKMVKNGRAANKADVVRKALIKLSEDEAVLAIILAEREPNLKGDLKTLIRKI